MNAEVVVFGATAGGVMAAVAAAEEGANVILVATGRHVGGMVTGGLGKTDLERQEQLIGGLARRFFVAAGDAYGEPIAWRFEPSVAETIMERLLADSGATVHRGEGLASVDLEEGRLTAIRLDDGTTLSADAFIDASYEGDLLRAAGVDHAIGRQGRERYGEPHAGRVELLPNPHQFRVTFSALAADGQLLPGVRPYDAIGPTGSGDGLVQSYCYRVCLTDDPQRRIPFARPPDYDPQRYVLLERYFAALGDAAGIRDVLGIGRIPNGKTDVNSGGPVSTNLLGGSWRYPTAEAPERTRIAEEHRTWTQGLLYLLATDPAVPQSIRDEMGALGWPADEFVDTGHFPHQLYVREAARLRGQHVLTEHDLRSERMPADAIGLGGYNIDIREVQWVAAPIYRFPDIQPEVMVEGYLSAPVPPWGIPYRSLLPRRDQCENLLVSVCISASHVAFSSFRMEPQYMIAGESAGVAAAMASRDRRAVDDVPIDELQGRLRARGQLLSPKGSLHR
ncbi:MAG: FAD-dependent oxidoreductase [Chloroflexi bacterium]|nr:FAD-dependent oxidoreductase [Chloroflexota bacterium]